MPQLRFPKRDTESLASALIDNNGGTGVGLSSTDAISVSYATSANGSTGKISFYFGLRIETTSPVTSNFTVKIYGLGFLCFPQMDFEAPLSLPSGAAWFEHIPLGSVTRDNDESTGGGNR
jgi:hypothetical protein